MLVLQSLVFGLLTCLLAFYAVFRWSRRRLYELAEKIPGPKGLPFIGKGLQFINVDFKQIFSTIKSITNGYESIIVATWLGPELVIFAHTPEALQIVLNSQKCLDKSPLYDVLVLTKGLLVGSGNLWRRHRKILNPSFSIGIIQDLIPTFDEKSKIFVKNLEVEVGKKPFEVYKYMSACSLETLLKGTMELNRDIQGKPLHNAYLHNIDEAAEIMMTKMVNVLYRFKPLYRLTKWYNLEQKHVINGLLTIADEVYDEKQALKEKFVETKDDDGYNKRPKNFINQLMNPKNGLTEEEIKQEINTLVAAGHETSALVVSNTLLMIALHPEVQRKIAQELKEVFGTVDAPVDYDSLNQLVYLDFVLKETMRLYPVLPVSARKSTDEFEIGDYTVPAGATVIVDAYAVQRNKKYWGEDADDFRPERFEPESFEKIHPYAYIPFTGGPRICIGWRYGMLFMKTVLSNVLRNYELSSELNYKDLEHEIILSMRIVQKTMIRLKKRDF